MRITLFDNNGLNILINLIYYWICRIERLLDDITKGSPC